MYVHDAIRLNARRALCSRAFIGQRALRLFESDPVKTQMQGSFLQSAKFEEVVGVVQVVRFVL